MGSGGRPRIIARIVVFTLNFAFWAAGILLITFGAIALIDPQIIVDMLNLIDGVSFVTGLIPIVDLLMGMAIFMIVLGSFLFLLGGNGCHGAWRKSRKSMMMYMVWLIVSIIVEIALIVYGCVYPGTTQDWITAEMQKSLNATFFPIEVVQNTGEIKYADQATDAYNWQMIQFETKCCGGSGYLDYNAIDNRRNGWSFQYLTESYTSPDVPPSCCRTHYSVGQQATNFSMIIYRAECMGTDVPPEPDSFNVDGCWKTAYDMLWQFNLIAIILASILIGTHLLALIFSIPLWKKDD